ncbi:MAG: protein kinase domain-containing protein [Gammaproteobacteria bacterium]
MAESATQRIPAIRLPEKIGKYTFIRHVGQGSTGNVHLSHDPYFGRDVAVKVYDIEADADPAQIKTARKMFFNEAHMVGMLQHPNILPLYDAGEENGKYYVVMEHVQGARTLAAYCRPDHLLPIDDVVKIIYTCAKALHYAHKRGVIHRDIKPSNIMLTRDNEVRIIDFGIALLRDADISRIEGIAGSPSYMSPEQIQSEEITPAADLYSLGALMYELLTGFRPFRASTLSRLLNQIVFATPPPLHQLRPDIPEDLEEIVAVSLQKDPSRRHSSAGDMAARLTRVYQGLREQEQRIDRTEQFNLLRHLSFFHEFSVEEIHEIHRAGEWHEYAPGNEIVREGEIDDRFYVIVDGQVEVESNGKPVGRLGEGDCFGEASYVAGSKGNSTIRAASSVTILSVSATLLEQVSTACQLRFTRVFLGEMIRRLQGANSPAN